MRYSRQDRIVSLLHSRGECAIADLARDLGTSQMTIRRDLDALAKAGKARRTFGGAAPAERVLFEFQFLERERTHRPAKAAIARAAAKVVRNGQSVLLDSGTTTLAVARELKARANLTVITTSLPIASELQYCQGVEVLLLGGAVRRNSPDLSGAMTEENIERLCADVALLGADGIDAAGNVYNASVAVARMLAKMAASARRVYVVADRSKVGRPALARFGNLARWAGLITDAGLDKSILRRLRRAGVRCILAKEKGNHE